LYYEKGKELNNEAILKQAEAYLDKYITLVPDGVLIDDARATINEIKLLYKRFEAKEISAKKTSNVQKFEMERRLQIRKRREEFRTNKRRLVGLSIYSYKFPSDLEFEASKKVIPEYEIIELKDIKNPVSQFEIIGGYIYNQFFFKGGLIYANNNADKQFIIDTVWSETQHQFVEQPGTITSIRTIQLSGEANCNFFFDDPLLFYAGGGLDVGSISIIDDDSHYDGNFLLGVGINLGVMLHFNDFLVDLSYKRNLVGTSSGSAVRFGVFYKF
jgi:hypothetical protein